MRAASIPVYCTGPALILTGSLMMINVVRIEWNDLNKAVPAFLTISLMPLTYSISYGALPDQAPCHAHKTNGGKPSEEQKQHTQCACSAAADLPCFPCLPLPAGQCLRAAMAPRPMWTAVSIIRLFNWHATQQMAKCAMQPLDTAPALQRRRAALKVR